MEKKSKNWRFNQWLTQINSPRRFLVHAVIVTCVKVNIIIIIIIITCLYLIIPLNKLFSYFSANLCWPWTEISLSCTWLITPRHQLTEVAGNYFLIIYMDLTLLFVLYNLQTVSFPWERHNPIFSSLANIANDETIYFPKKCSWNN